MILRFVGPDHPIPLGNLPAKVRKDLTLSSAVQFAVLAEEGKRLVGFLRYEFDQRGVLIAAGTWVAPEGRKRGVAADLWRHVLKRVRPRKLWVKCVSVGGRALVTSLIREFPKVHWTVV